MTKQTRGSNRNGRRRDPNQDVQPWLGWIAAGLVVVIVVVAVAMGMERTNNQRNSAAEVRMTPLVGGMEVAVVTEEAGGDAQAEVQVTPIPAVITETSVITPTDSMTVNLPATSPVTGSVSVTETGRITSADSVTATGELTTTGTVTATAEMSVTVEVTATPEATVEATSVSTSTAEPGPTPSATATAQATPTPTVTPTVIVQTFEPGDVVVADAGGVQVYADASQESIVLDSFGSGVELEILVPSGDYSGYPIVIDGHGWARVRAADGLVGWIMTEQVEAQ